MCGYNKIKNHPLQDGNKRLGLVLGNYFLNINGYNLTSSEEELFNIALDVARSKIDKEEIYDWLKINTKKH